MMRTMMTKGSLTECIQVELRKERPGEMKEENVNERKEGKLGEMKEVKPFPFQPSVKC